MLANSSLTPRVAVIIPFLLPGAACGPSRSKSDSAAAGGDVSAPNASPMVRGVVSSVTPSSLIVQTDTGSVTIAVGSAKTFDRQPGSLSDVTNDVFVGVTSVKQPDGTEQATEIHVFPQELRGLGEGSRMMTPAAAPAGSRMTNGSVATSRMSNGTVANANGGRIVVNYSGGAQTIDVPSSTAVTTIKETSRKPVAGDQVVVVSKRGDNGSLVANAVLFAK